MGEQRFKEVEPLCVYGNHAAAEVSPDHGRPHWKGVYIFLNNQTWSYDNARALRDWLSRALDDGMVPVPREPTKEMIVAGQVEHDNCVDTCYDSNSDGDHFEYTTISPDAPYRVYRAMLAAAIAEQGKEK